MGKIEQKIYTLCHMDAEFIVSLDKCSEKDRWNPDKITAENERAN